jgi:hypothetical protein
MTRFRSIKFHLPAFFFFLGIGALQLWWPLFHADSHVGDTLPTDYYHFHWNYWWIRHALTTPGLNVYESDFVLFPHMNNLALHTLTPAWFPAWALLEPLTGTLVAMNIIMVIECALTGYLFFLLLKREGVPTSLALPGALILQLTPAVLLSAFLTNINYLGIYWYPALLLSWGKVVESVIPTPRSLSRSQPPHTWGGGKGRGLFWSLVLGLAFYGMMMTDYQHALFVAFLLVPYGVWTLIRVGGERTRRSASLREGWYYRLRLALMGLLALVVMLALLWLAGPLPYLLEFDRSTLSPQPIEDAKGMPFPDGYVSRLSPYTRKISLGALVLPGVVVVGSIVFIRRMLKASGYRLKKSTKVDSDSVSELVPFRGLQDNSAEGFNPRCAPLLFWLILMIPPLLLSAGATVMIAGTEISTPYVWMYNLFGGLFRVPARFSPVIVIPAVIFIGKSLKALFVGTRYTMSDFRTRALYITPLQRRLLIGVFCTLLVLIESRLFEKMPLRPAAEPYEFYTVMGQERGEPYDDYAVIDVPVAGGSGEAWVGDFPPMETQWYAMTHQKRVLNGSLARAPLEHFWYWLYEDPMLAWLGQRRYLEPDEVEEQLRDRIFRWPVGYIVVHQKFIEQAAPTNQEIIGYFNSLPDLLCPPIVERDAVFYRTRWHPDGCPDRTPPEIEPGVYQIDIGATGDERFVGWGWHYAEAIAGLSMRWTGEYPDTKVFVDLPPGDYRLSLSAQAYQEARELRVTVNGVVVNPTAALGEEVPTQRGGVGGEANFVSITPDTLQTYNFNLPSNVIGDGHHLTITLEYDDTITPADINQGTDERKLALLVDWLRFEKQ